MKVLVTGANGYLGQGIVKALLDKGEQVIAADFKVDNIDDRAEKVTTDLFANDDPYNEFHRPDVLLHLAWRDGFVHNSDSHINDLPLHYSFLKKMIDGGCKHICIMGTMHEVGFFEGEIDENTPCNPISMYGIAKDALRRAMLQYTAQKGRILQWLRCYYILGDDKKNNSIFCKLLTAAEEGKKTFPFTTGKNKYDFIKVDHLADLISTTVMQHEINGIINCSTGTPISLAQQVESFIDEHNLDITLKYGAFPDRPYDSPCVYGDASKIQLIMNNQK